MHNCAVFGEAYLTIHYALHNIQLLSSFVCRKSNVGSKNKKILRTAADGRSLMFVDSYGGQASRQNGSSMGLPPCQFGRCIVGECYRK